MAFNTGQVWVELPYARGRKYSTAGREWVWQWIFPATRLYVDRDTRQRRRHHLHESLLQRVVKGAVRFDTADRSMVISGDTNQSDNLVKLAQGADVLVHEALYVPAVDRLVARVPNAATLKKHIIDSHTAVGG